MLYVNNRGITDPRINLALEEYVLRHRFPGEDCLLFYVNEPSIIIGRNQNTIEEVDPVVVRERGLHVVRRISGGGAVYHDLGNLNFSFMTPYRPDRFNRYEHFLRPVMEELQSLGVPAELGGRNDLVADGRKISGNAQFMTSGRMFSHGTLLFDSNLDDVVAALTPRPGKVESKGHKSVRSRVANISEFLTGPLTVEGLRQRLVQRIFAGHAAPPELELNEADWDAVSKLVAEKYGTWEWNYGKSPACNVQRARRFPFGEIDVRIDVQDGLIGGIRFFGDFIGRREVVDLEQQLTGARFEHGALSELLAGVELTEFFGELGEDEMLELLLG